MPSTALAMSVDVASVALNGRDVLILGTPALEWPTTGLSGPVAPGSLIGALVDGTDRVVAVPNPLPGHHVIFPHAVSSPRGGWDAEFGEALTSSDPYREFVDSAALWFGHFTGTRWTDIEQITTVTYAKLSPSLASDLVRVGGKVAFAFGFDRSAVMTGSNPDGNQGVVLLLGSTGHWSIDTLALLLGPNYVKAFARDTTTIVAAIIAPYFEYEGRLRIRASTVLVATHGLAWASPTKIAGDGIHPVYALAIAGAGSVEIASWLVDGPDGAPGIETTTVDSTHPADSGQRLGTGSREFAFVSLTPDTIVWFSRSERSTNSFRVTMRAGARIVDLGSVEIANDGASYIHAVRTGDSRILLIATQLGQSGHGAPVTTFVNELRLICSAGN